MKILLIRPPTTYQVWAGVPDVFSKQGAYLFPPLAIMYLSGYLKKYSRHQVKMLDAIHGNLDFSDIAQAIEDFTPHAVGIFSATHALVNVVKVIEQAKLVAPNSYVILGGPHVTSFPQEAIQLKGVDAVIRGDGEIPLKELLDTLDSAGDLKGIKGLIFKERGEIIHNPPRKEHLNLDELPFPDRAGLSLDGYYTPAMVKARATTVISSRGCPYRCLFCDVPRKYRTRSAKNIVDELQECVERYKIEEVHFIDDIFNITPQRVTEICDEILERRLKIYWGCKASCDNVNPEMLEKAKAAGCVRMHYGVETFTDEGLRALHKGPGVTIEQVKRAFSWTRKAGIKSIAYMIIGCPHEKSKKEILGVSKFIKALDPDYVVYSLFTPYPDAPIFKVGTDLGLWQQDCWKRFMLNPREDFDLPTAWEQYLTKNDLLEVFKSVNRAFYFSPRVLFRTLGAIRTFTELKRLIKGGISLIRMLFLSTKKKEI